MGLIIRVVTGGERRLCALCCIKLKQNCLSPSFLTESGSRLLASESEGDLRSLKSFLIRF